MGRSTTCTGSSSGTRTTGSRWRRGASTRSRRSRMGLPVSGVPVWAGGGATGARRPAEGCPGAAEGVGDSRTVEGEMAVWVVLLGYSTSFLTFTKTVLYWLNEVFSGFENIGHNSWSSLFFLWIVPNGAWLVLPAYMIYVFGQEIIQGLLVATNGGKKSG
ncbi:hypothetical protein BTJ68_03422 [Hortaea werneckii EXF-2000]|uniref:EXPERA domain-containing protein n=1 Tax=Hortaea werneckii EXF-2000 TaxID=1157616 RepID=A0A1Z5TJI1_HORWE|nr:hypothetical protein BTJ68_03422 [Hortaea werneckii EXF-2000]